MGHQRVQAAFRFFRSAAYLISTSLSLLTNRRERIRIKSENLKFSPVLCANKKQAKNAVSFPKSGREVGVFCPGLGIYDQGWRKANGSQKCCEFKILRRLSGKWVKKAFFF